MTESEIARDKFRLWNLIARAKRVNFPIPDHWLKYGHGPRSSSELVSAGIASISDKIPSLFERDSEFYTRIGR